MSEPKMDIDALRRQVAATTSEDIDTKYVMELALRQFYGAWLEKNAIRMMVSIEERDRLPFVWQNLRALRDVGILEAAFVEAYNEMDAAMGHSHYQLADHIVMYCDRDRLRVLGDTLPDQDRFRIYRGVGSTRIRNIWRRMSWTLDKGVASWFAQQYRACGGGSEVSPAVFTAEVNVGDILLYYRGRGEEEVLIDVNALTTKPRRLKVLPDVRRPRAP